MTAFFQNNFALDKWRKSAQKNAYVLMGKQRFEHAAAFFLLGGDLKTAVEVSIYSFILFFFPTKSALFNFLILEERLGFKKSCYLMSISPKLETLN